MIQHAHHQMKSSSPVRASVDIIVHLVESCCAQRVLFVRSRLNPKRTRDTSHTMMDAIVQLIRNALCCIKDLGLFRETKLQDPGYTALFYDFPEPMDKTTPLELLICASQFYAFVSNTRSGFRLMTESGIGKLRRIHRLLEIQSRKSLHSLPNKLARESLVHEQSVARRSVFIGFGVMCIGFSFFWLFANSLHVTETNWIGGLQGLINALTVMEVFLLPLLYFMLEDTFAQFQKSKRMEQLVLVLQGTNNGGVVPGDMLNPEIYAWIVNGGWSPFWTHTYGVLEPLPDEIQDLKKLNDEVVKLTTTIDALTTTGNKKDSSAALSSALSKTAERLQDEIPTVRMEGYRGLLYFVLNSIAFYGYLLGIVVYYSQAEEVQSYTVRGLKLGMTNAAADWHGNFAGDLMWTIEPMIILGSPALLTWMKPKPQKVKTE